jgi:ATP-binding protein involved in chromosome partitioning
MQENLKHVKHKIFVMSGKGGVGKSTVAVNLAVSFAMKGFKVGLMDLDIHGPSVPKLLDLENEKLYSKDKKIVPIEKDGNLKVVSIGFVLKNTSDAVIWRGPRKAMLIDQFVKDVNWGNLDYLIIDLPPGTGDEALSIVNLIPEADGSIIVTTPQEVALSDVRKAISFCNELNVNILGIVENMSYFLCPKCSDKIKVFNGNGGKVLKEEIKKGFLVSLPIEPELGVMADKGVPFVSKENKNSLVKKAFNDLINSLINSTFNKENKLKEERI